MMNKYKISLQAYHWAILLLMLSSVTSMAQSNILLPGACSTCPVGAEGSTNGTAVVSNYGNVSCGNSSFGTINGTLIQGVPVSGVTMTLYANVTILGTYSLISTQNGVTFLGSGTFTELGCQPVTLTAAGTPTAAGSFAWCTNSTPQGCITATVTTKTINNGTGIASSYGAPACAANVINGTITVGVPVDGVTMSLYANVTTLGSYNITIGPTNGVTFAGSGTFTALGCQLVTLTAKGTPTAGIDASTTNTTPSGSTTTTTTTTTTARPPNGSIPPVPGILALPLGTSLPGFGGSFKGKKCFDVAKSNDNTNGCGKLSGRTPIKADFTLPATNTQTYTFVPNGKVSNVRFRYVNTNGSAITNLVGGNAGNNFSTSVTATVTYANTLNDSATGRTNNNPITSDIYVIYNAGPTKDSPEQELKVTVNIKDCQCCGAMVSGVFREFLCHNLGADTSLDPHVPVMGINGAYAKFGVRGPNITGDSRVDWQTYPNDYTLGFRAAPTIANRGNWISENHNERWYSSAENWVKNGVKTTWDPCPDGYRVPTQAEMKSAYSSPNVVSKTGPFNTVKTFPELYDDPRQYMSAFQIGPDASTPRLTFPAAGFLQNYSTSIIQRGYEGYYIHSNGTYTTFNSQPLPDNGRTTLPDYTTLNYNHYSVRCISE